MAGAGARGAWALRRRAGLWAQVLDDEEMLKDFDPSKVDPSAMNDMMGNPMIQARRPRPDLMMMMYRANPPPPSPRFQTRERRDGPARPGPPRVPPVAARRSARRGARAQALQNQMMSDPETMKEFQSVRCRPPCPSLPVQIGRTHLPPVGIGRTSLTLPIQIGRTHVSPHAKRTPARRRSTSVTSPGASVR